MIVPLSPQPPPPSAPVRISVAPDRVLNRITPAMYGACLEDVNHEIYGGLYAQRIFGESFEEPAPDTSPRGWGTLGGDWTPEGVGIVHVRGGDGPKLVHEGATFADGEAEARVRLTNDLGENAGLLVRVARAGVGADDFDGYEVSMSAKHRTIVLGRHRHDFRALASVAAPIVPGRWHRLRVRLDGARIQVFLDDETTPRIDHTDDTPLGTGGVALRNWRADAAFRDVRVKGTLAPLSLAGEGVSRYWDRVRGGDAIARYAVEEGAWNGALCQRIEHRGGTGRVGIANRGLNRWGISIVRGHAMEGRLGLRGDVGEATVALQSADGARTYASQRVKVGRAWGRATFRLRPSVTDPNARFVVWIDRPGALWADAAVLLDAPEERYQGLPVRRDVAETLFGSGAGFLRYGGTMVNVPGYRWKSMIGDPDRRPPYAGHWNPVSTNGFGIFDFLNLCERAGVGAAFAISVDETPEDAADLAEYLTAPVTTPWGRRRAADGHPAPYRPAYLQIGNEEGIGNPDAVAMARYAARFRGLARAIHGRAPNLRLVGGAWWVPDKPAMRTVFDALDGEATAWDLHFWCDAPDAGRSVGRELDRVRASFQKWNPATNLKAVVFEENGNRHDLARALGHATTLNATRRRGDFVLADCAANALQPWRQNDNGWDQGGVFFTPDRAWTMPPADARRLMAEDALPVRVATEIDGGDRDREALDVLATRSEEGGTLALTLVNPTDRSIPVTISAGTISTGTIATGTFRARSVRARTLSGALDAANPPYRAKAITPVPLPASVRNGVLEALVPPRSVTSLRYVR